MGAVRHGVPQELVLFLKREGGFNLFVETGTLTGETAAWAAGHFENVATIEAQADRANWAAVRLFSFRNVRVHFEDSRRYLKTILNMTVGPAILWLDAHWMGPGSGTAGEGGVECPVLAEIMAAREGDVIIVDDARLFLAPPPHPHNPAKWPDVWALTAALALGNRKVIVFEDAFVALPQSLAPALVAWVQERVTRAWLNP